MKNYRANAICVYRILSEYSNADNIMPMRQLIAKIKEHYDIDMDRRTVYSAVDTLKSFDIDISDFSDNGKGYYLIDRPLELSQVRLLTDAVYSSRMITVNETERLIDSLQKILCVYDRHGYSSMSVIKNDKKTSNQEVFLNVELIDDAIEKGLQVSFEYMEYGFDKKLHPRRKEKYIRDPFAMLSTNGRYYLLCKSKKHNEFANYRIDRMRNVTVLEDERETSTNRKEIEAALKNTINGWQGEPERITMRCENRILDDALEVFGRDITVKQDGEDHFIMHTMVAPMGAAVWAMKYIDCVEITSPKWIRDKIKKKIEDNLYGA